MVNPLDKQTLLGIGIGIPLAAIVIVVFLSGNKSDLAVGTAALVGTSTPAPQVEASVTPRSNDTLRNPKATNIPIVDGPIPTVIPQPSTVPHETIQAQPDTQAKYNAQYLVVQAKLSPLRDQLDLLNSQSTLLATNQATAVSEYISAIQKDFSYLQPVTDSSIIYENQLDALQQQIFNVKMDYYQQSYYIVHPASGYGTSISVQQGKQQILDASTNSKIVALNQQIQDVYSSYLASVGQ